MILALIRVNATAKISPPFPKRSGIFWQEAGAVESMIDQPSRTLCCWPGLAGLWLRGQWSSLLVAVGFSLILNLALVSTFVWPGVLGTPVKQLMWPLVVSVWLLFGWKSWCFLKRCEPSSPEPGQDDDGLFIQAQTEYLKGDYSAVERLLVERLQAQSRDAESRLLLVSLYRRTGRVEQARRQLDLLQRLDDSIRWRFEMDRERRRLGPSARIISEDHNQESSGSGATAGRKESRVTAGDETFPVELPSETTNDTTQRAA
jgi:hypothetical protein